MKLSWLYFVTFDSYKEGTVSADGCYQGISLYYGACCIEALLDMDCDIHVNLQPKKSVVQ